MHYNMFVIELKCDLQFENQYIYLVTEQKISAIVRNSIQF